MGRRPTRLVRFAREMRKNPTPAEKAMWYALRKGQAGTKFRRQEVIGHFIVDFVSHEHRLVVEIDGPRHGNLRRMEMDRRRDDHLAELGYQVVRFDEYKVQDNPLGFADEIWELIHHHRLPPTDECAPGVDV